MTTSLTYSPLDHSTTAGFRLWGAEFHAQLLACGLTLSSDTGQINWTTATIGAINTYPGYEVWQFNDTLQSTTPIFLIFQFGTSNYLPSPSIKITVCGATNGAGTAVGYNVVFYCGGSNYNVAPASTSVFYPSRFCYNAALGFFGFAWKTGANTNSGSTNASYLSAFIFRSNNSAGAPTGTTVNVLTSAGGQLAVAGYGDMICLNFAQGVSYPSTYALSQYWSFRPFMQPSTIINAQIAVDPVFFMTPSMGITPTLARGLITEIPMGSQISLTLVGSTPCNYIQVGNAFPSYGTVAYTGLDAATQTNANVGLLMLWQ